MRKRVSNIIDRGELDDIHILEYINNGKSDIKRIKKNGIEYLQFNNYSYIYPADHTPGELTIPATMFLHVKNYTYHAKKNFYL